MSKAVEGELRSFHLPEVKNDLSRDQRQATLDAKPEEKRMMIFAGLRRFSYARHGAWLALIVAAASALWAHAGIAHGARPFVEFLGNWRGSGHVVGSDGHLERISCHASYLETGGGEALSQSLICASDSYRFDVHSYVVADGRSVQGHWEETTRNVTGRLIGRVEYGEFEGSISGPTFTAQMSLKTTGRQQAVSIIPQGGDIAKVDIVLSRD